MRMKIKFGVILGLIVGTFSNAGTVVSAQTSGDKHFHPDVAIDYDYIHSNAPPGGCGCINLNGASATFAWPVLWRSFSLVARVSGAAGAMQTSDLTLHLSTFTGGVRYQPRFTYRSIQPFGQVLVGAARASGALLSGQSGGTAFAADLGGGFDLRVKKQFSIRLVEADYLVTTFDNGVNDHQNNFRLGAGIVLHF